VIPDEQLGLSSGAVDRDPVAEVPAQEAGAPPPEPETDEARIRRMVEAHFDALWRFMRRLGVDVPDLDDAVQEVVVIAAGRLAEIPAASERSFLFGTAFRVANAHRRKREARREVGDRALESRRDPLPEPDALADQARARALLDQILELMPPDERAVFTLYEIEEMTMSEIAELLDIPPGTVASRLRRGREQFEAHVDRLQARAKAHPSPAAPASRRGKTRGT
jgi:RNA polymerase sigma-70 factor (ECF subfamily)